jgi:hypothetical protein
MRRVLLLALLTGAAIVLGVAGLAVAGYQGTVVQAGDIVLRLNGGVAPKALPASKWAPLSIFAGGTLSTLDGTHLPALKEVSLDTDKDILISVKGLPRCRFDELEARPPSGVEAACGTAIIGKGKATVEVALPEQEPFEASGPLIILNGGERRGTITLLAYTYVDVPAPTVVVTTATLTRERKGPFGLHSVIHVPRIAGGAGSIVQASLSAHRTYAYKGKRRSVFSGRCPDDRFFAKGTFKFRDGTEISGSFVQDCKATG